MSVIRDGGFRHLGVVSAAVEKELLDLVAANVAEDAAVFGAFEKPRGPSRRVEPVRTEAEDADDAADGALGDELAGENRALHVESLAVIDHVFPAGFCRDRARVVELRQRG